MSLHFHDSLFADFSFAQGKSIRCLCFAQLRTSFRLADNVASLADVRRATRQCRALPNRAANDRWLSNFDQFFVGLPISLYERPHRTSVGPRLAADVVRLVPVFPPGNVSQPPTLSWDASASNRSNGGSAQIR